jgi:hypothetical protein
MKRLLLVSVLAWSAAANAQDGQGSDQCTPEASPVIERVNVATATRPTETSAVVEIDLEAALPDGRALSYAFQPSSGSITSDGPHASWTVEGEGPFTATIEVSAADYPCKSYANLTYRMEEDLVPEE